MSETVVDRSRPLSQCAFPKSALGAQREPETSHSASKFPVSKQSDVMILPIAEKLTTDAAMSTHNPLNHITCNCGLHRCLPAAIRQGFACRGILPAVVLHISCSPRGITDSNCTPPRRPTHPALASARHEAGSTHSSWCVWMTSRWWRSTSAFMARISSRVVPNRSAILCRVSPGTTEYTCPVG